MVKNFFIIIFVLLITDSVNSQANLLNSTKAIEIGVKSDAQKVVDNDAPLPYGYVADRDVLWSTIVWEYIDLTQKFNFPYYFPKDASAGKEAVPSNRRSLFDNLINAIKTKQIKKVYEDSEFEKVLEQKFIDEALKYVYVEKGQDDITYYLKNEDILGYQIKGMWYFDKRQGELKYRLLGIAPMGPDLPSKYGAQKESLDEVSTNDGEVEMLPVFWVFYPTARDVLHKAKVFNPKNASHPISYDHMLNSRRFHSVIIKQENVYGNRAIGDYIKKNSLFQLLESERIKEEIRNKEIDMWNY